MKLFGIYKHALCPNPLCVAVVAVFLSSAVLAFVEDLDDT